jgi:chitinase
MIKQLRLLFATNPCKEYLITGAPQCSVPDTNMGTMISQAQFDILWIQFYNTPKCSARTWANGNSGLNNSNPSTKTAGFTYDAWVDTLRGGASENAKLYIGLLGAPSDSPDSGTDFLWPKEVSNLIKTYHKASSFGGVMLWEATGANGQEVLSNEGTSGNLVTYYEYVKSVLNQYAPSFTVTPPALCSGTTSSSTSTTST